MAELETLSIDMSNTSFSRFDELLAGFVGKTKLTESELKELSNLAMELFADHGQLGPLNRLYETLIEHKIFSARTLVIWAKLYAPIGQKQGKFVKNTTNMEEVDEQYKSVNFWECEPEEKVVDNSVTMSEIVKTFEKMVQKFDAPEKRLTDKHAKNALRELKKAQHSFEEALREAEAASYFGKSASELHNLVKAADETVAA
jgi:hypothetical protein